MWDCDKNAERKCFKLAIRDFIFLAVSFITYSNFHVKYDSWWKY